MLNAVYTRLMTRVIDSLSRDDDRARLAASMNSIQQARKVVREAQEGLLHFFMLPARTDIQRMRQKVMRLRRDVKRLEYELEHVNTMLSRTEVASKVSAVERDPDS